MSGYFENGKWIPHPIVSTKLSEPAFLPMNPFGIQIKVSPVASMGTAIYVGSTIYVSPPGFLKGAWIEPMDLIAKMIKELQK